MRNLLKTVQVERRTKAKDLLASLGLDQRYAVYSSQKQRVLTANETVQGEATIIPLVAGGSVKCLVCERHDRILNELTDPKLREQIEAKELKRINRIIGLVKGNMRRHREAKHRGK